MKIHPQIHEAVSPSHLQTVQVGPKTESSVFKTTMQVQLPCNNILMMHMVTLVTKIWVITKHSESLHFQFFKVLNVKSRKRS